MGYSENIQRAEQNLRQAHANRNAAIAAAAKGVQEAQVRYESRVQSAEKEIESVEESFTRPIASFAGIDLYADRVSDGKTELLLVEGVDSVIETSGNKSYGGKAADKRKLSLTINAADGRRITAMGDPNKEARAREFAALIMNTAAVAPVRVADREAGYPRLRAQLKAARADTRELDAARAAYEAAVNDPSVQQAQLVLDDLKVNAPQSELAAYEDAKQCKRYQHRAITRLKPFHHLANGDAKSAGDALLGLDPDIYLAVFHFCEVASVDSGGLRESALRQPVLVAQLFHSQTECLLDIHEYHAKENC